nr:abc transporter g family member 24 [Quercus suber]
MGRESCGQAQGVLEPLVCDAGRYCPFDNATKRYGKESIICPAGFFCPTGSYEPWKCLYGASCPEGSPRQLNTLPLWVVIGIDVILGIIVAVGFAISKWRKSRPKKYTTLEGGNGHGDDVELLGAQAMPAKSPRLSVSAPGSHTAPVPLRLVSAHNRRMSGRADYWDGGYDDPETNIYDADPLEDEYHNSPDFQRFLRSMAKTIETNSIGLSFDFENLSFETKGKKILQEVTGTMPRGSCWGVMGGSGAGKSTFLNALMGKIKISGGNIMINGWKKDMSKYKKLIGYVPQDDIVFPELTVRENILHSGRIRLPATWRDKQIQDHVDALIACLQLTHVQHSRVGDASKPIISGGQRKRVNIGMELAAAPMAIFLDEPTSGLDSSSAATIMRLLRALSRLGMTVISIIHQPREQIFYGFDQLLLLSQGRSVYSGPTDEMQSYFESLGFAFPQRANPADTLMDIITGEGAQYTTGAGKMETDVKSLIDEWRARGQYQIHNRHLSVGSDLKSQRRRSNQSMNSTVQQEDNLVRTMKARGASWPAQIFYCWKRAMTQQVRKATSFFFEIGVGGLAVR